MFQPVKKSGIPQFGGIGINNTSTLNRSFISGLPTPTSSLARPADLNSSLVFPKSTNPFTSSPNSSQIPSFNTSFNSSIAGTDSSIESLNSSIPSLDVTVVKKSKRNSFYATTNIEKKHIGKEVLVSGSEYGILKYVGPVDFEKGIWCGVELANPVGKHDGLVKGVRYFTCKPNHGCLAPKPRVELVIPEGQSNFEKLKSKFEASSHNESGPYSLIELPDLKDAVRQDCQNVFNETANLTDKRHTFVIENDINDVTFTLPDEKDGDQNTFMEIKPSKHELRSNLTSLTFSNRKKQFPQKSFFDNFASTSTEQLTLSLNPVTNFPSAFFTKKSPIITDMNPQASFDFDESLGILTPDQMCEFPKTPSTDDLRVLLNDFNIPRPLLLSPTAPENSAADLSLGLLNDEILNTPFHDHSLSNLDTTINMELPLDTKPIIIRSDQTPSPEDLPLDPISKLESKSKASTASYVMSISSITSLDNGYQGDGEMSRPASRGGDHSPTVHKINTNPTTRVIRRPDPMTDSDFFTESDADIHDDNHSKNDRKAQVIDGHLYGLLNAPNQQPAGEEIFVQEEMDSSGVFTDLETRNSEPIQPIKTNELDHTPCSDISSKTISENSQLNQPERKTESCQSSPSHKSSSPKFSKTKDDNVVKKYKMPRRNVQSKVKTMLELPKSKNIENQENCKPAALKKGTNKWDAIMSKISDTKISTTKLKEVKSKVATGLGGDVHVTAKRTSSKAFSQNTTAKNSPNNSTKLKRYV